MTNWWEKPLRAVTLELPAADITQLNLRDVVRRLGRHGVNTLNVFAISYWPGGAAYYQSSIAPHHPDLGDRDILAEAVDEAQEHKIRTVAYVNTLWGDRDMFEKHPEWAQRRANGSITTWEENLTAVAMCPNTPYREYILRVGKEIADNYELDGFYFDEPSFQSWCNCEGCRESFKSKTRMELPTKPNWGAASWQTFIHWRYNSITDFKKALYRVSKEPDRAIFFQHPFPLSFWSPERVAAVFTAPEDELTRYVKQCADWYVPLFYGADLRATAELEDIIHLELYRSTVDQPTWWYGVCIRLANSVGKGKPQMALNMQGQSPFDLYSLPEAELRLVVGEIVANGSNPLFALYYPDIADKRGWQTIGKIFNELDACEEYLVDRESVKHAAVLHSTTTTDLHDSETASPRHVNCLMGFSKALLQDHILFDVITENQLENDLRKYKVLILPNVASLSGADCGLIEEFVDKGGGVVASYRTSLHNEAGRELDRLGLENVLGVSYVGRERTVAGYDSYMKVGPTHAVTSDLPEIMYVPSTGSQLEIRPIGRACPLATLIDEPEAHYAPLKRETRIPTIVVNEYGSGRSVYFPGPIGEMYRRFGVVDHWRFMSNAARWAAGEEQHVWVENCPKNVELTAYHQFGKDRTVMHLVNCVRHEITEPISYVSPEHQIKVHVETDKSRKAVRVFTMPGNRMLPFEREGDTVSLYVPELKYHQIIVVEKE